MTDGKSAEVADAENRIIELVKERAEGGPNRRLEALEIAGEHGIKGAWVTGLFDEAEETLNQATEVWITNTEPEPEREPEGSFKKPEAQPDVEKPAKVKSALDERERFKAREGRQAQVREEPKVEKEEPAAKIGKGGERRYDWSEVVVPEGVSDIEALTYVPGLVGQIVEWIVYGARRPNR